MAKTTLRIKNHKAVIDKIIKGWRQIGEDIFDKSQDDCPVDEGTLKGTGAQLSGPTPGGYTIIYRTSYAARQEFGVLPGTVEYVKRHHVRKHKRKTLVHKKYVKAHDRGPIYRQFPAGIDGKYFLTNAYEEMKPRLVRVLVRHIGKL